MPSDTSASVALQPARRRRSIPPAQVLKNAKQATKGSKPVGRPLSYSPDLCDRAIQLGMKGKHWAAIAREFNVDRGTLTKWKADYPEFSNALDRARAASQAWWEDKLQSKLGAKHFQANAARLVMSGQFKEDYAENSGARVDITLDLGGAIAEIEARRRPSDAKPVEVASSFAPLADPKKAKE